MSGAIYQAASGAVNYQMNLEVLANNLANLNTVGFKAEQAVFRLPDAQNETPQNTGNLTTDATGQFLSLIPPETATDFSQGQLQQTGNPLDLALHGKGFFRVQTPEGVRYTRNGSLHSIRMAGS
jgi:flagellar hook-basal body protein